MDCLLCGAIGDIAALHHLEGEDGSHTYTWRSSCVNGHVRDHFWFHGDAVTEDPEDAFTAPVEDGE